MDCYTQERPSQWIRLLEPATLWTLFDFFLAFFSKRNMPSKLLKLPVFPQSFAVFHSQRIHVRNIYLHFRLNVAGLCQSGQQAVGTLLHRSFRCPLSSGMGGGYWPRPSPEIARAAREQLADFYDLFAGITRSKAWSFMSFSYLVIAPLDEDIITMHLFPVQNGHSHRMSTRIPQDLPKDLMSWIQIWRLKRSLGSSINRPWITKSIGRKS